MQVINNEGYNFSFKGDTVQVFDQFGRNLKVDQVVNTTHQNMQQALNDIEKRTPKKTYDVQYYQINGQNVVVIGPYGLKGGGFKQTTGCGAGLAQIFAGAATLNPFLIGSGFNGFRYCWNTPENDITITGFAQRSAVGAAAGGAAAAAAAFAGPAAATYGASAFTANMTAGAAANIVGNTTSTITESVVTLNADHLNNITPTKIIKDGVIGAMTGGVGGEVLKQAAANGVTSPMASYGAAGAAGSAAAQVTENTINNMNFLQVCYANPPADAQMELDRVYLYIASDGVIHYKTIYDYTYLDFVISENPHIFHIAPDGDCLFGSISHQLSWLGLKPRILQQLLSDQTFATLRNHPEWFDQPLPETDEACKLYLSNLPQPKQIRLLAVSAIQNHPELLNTYPIETEETLGAYLARMARDGEWGDVLEIVVLSNALQICITVMQDNVPPFITGDQQLPRIHINYIDGNHYDSVIAHGTYEQIEPIRVVLRSGGNITLNAEQRDFVLRAAAHNELRLKSILENVGEAALMGAGSGVVLGVSQVKQTNPATKVEEPTTQRMETPHSHRDGTNNQIRFKPAPAIGKGRSSFFSRHPEVLKNMAHQMKQTANVGNNFLKQQGSYPSMQNRMPTSFPTETQMPSGRTAPLPPQMPSGHSAKVPPMSSGHTAPLPPQEPPAGNTVKVPRPAFSDPFSASPAEREKLASRFPNAHQAGRANVGIVRAGLNPVKFLGGTIGSVMK